jgi:flagellar hook-basal body complex protein FliE
MSVENLQAILGSGDVERLMGGGSVGSATAELKAFREAKENGLETGAGAAKGVGFGDLLRDSMAKVNEYQVQADTAIKEAVAGRSKNLHETLLTIERADASLKLMMQVRNKILDAYREIMRMQV